MVTMYKHGNDFFYLPPENSDPKPTVIESKLTSGSSASAKNGVKESTGFPLSPSSSSFSPHMKDLHSTHVVVPLIKPSAGVVTQYTKMHHYINMYDAKSLDL